MHNIVVTVFTATYNRGYIIEKLYNSLLRQTNYNFEWLVIDDGSKDDTEDIFKVVLKNNNPFPIRFIKKENGGLHRAINDGVKMALGSLFFIVDSDDILTDDSIETIIKWNNSMPSNQQFAGFAGLKGYFDHSLVGTTFEGDFLDCTSLERKEHNINGDKAEVFYTTLLKMFPFKTFDNENFIEISTVWTAIAAAGYKIRWYNKIIYLCEYIDDGLTKNHQEILKKNPHGYAYYLKNVTIKYGHYSRRDVLNIYYNYWTLVKDNISINKCANYLEINVIKMFFIVVRCRLRDFLRKIVK